MKRDGSCCGTTRFQFYHRLTFFVVAKNVLLESLSVMGKEKATRQKWLFYESLLLSTKKVIQRLLKSEQCYLNPNAIDCSKTLLLSSLLVSSFPMLPTIELHRQ